MVNQGEARRAFEKAPRLPVAWTSSASLFTEKVKVDPLLFDDAIALHATDVYPKYPLLVRERPKNPSEAQDASAGSRTAVNARRRPNRMGSGGEWGNGIRADFRTQRRINHQFQGTDARPWIPEGRNGLA